MERPQVESKIADALKNYPKGSILFVDDFPLPGPLASATAPV